MRVTFFGLLIAVLAALLMCRGMTVEADHAALPEAPADIVGETAMMPAQARTPDCRDDAERESSPFGGLKCVRPALKRIPVPVRETDANGTPVLLSVYYRSRYQAFCLTDSGG